MINKKLALVLCGAGLALGLTGCSTFDKDNDRWEPKGWFDPTAVGRWQGEPLMVPILPTLGTQYEEPDAAFAAATDVQPQDLVATTQDYDIGPNDLLSVSITDLVGPGVETVKQQRVSESGNISLPLIGQIRAEGLTEAELEKVVQQAYRDANLIQNAQVSVIVAEARARTFSILGSVAAPGQYAIIKADFRILDALVMARDVNAQGVDYLYVIRERAENDSNADTTRPATQGAEQTTPAQGPSPDLLAPQAPAKDEAPKKTESPAPAADQQAQPSTTTTLSGGQDGHLVVIDGKTRTIGSQGGDVTASATASQPVDNKDAAGAAQASAQATSQDSVQAADGKDFQFNSIGPVTDQRIIRIPLNDLKNGDLRYNVVIRPNDMILVPTPTIGEYYMGGHVARVGVYSLTGRKITLKQAVVSSGMFDGLAIPARTELIRRVGDNKEIFVKVNLDDIFAGTQPDIYLKPNDVVNVGTNAIAPFMAALRGAFRITYGFGFLYDRNYAYDRDLQGR